MASPQIENGHVDIANSLIEALAKIRISGEEMQCLWVVLRKTYGWHKKSDHISLSQFALATGLKRPGIVRALNKLLTKKIIAIDKKDNSGINIYSINKDFDIWIPLTKKITVLTKKITDVDNNDNKLLTKKIHTKETPKETTQKKKDIYVFSSDNFETFWKKYPPKNGKVIGKKECLEYLKSLKFIEWESLLKAIDNYSNSEKVEEGYIRDPIRFLKKDYWKDWVEAEKKEKESIFDTPQPSISHEEPKYYEHEPYDPEKVRKVQDIVKELDEKLKMDRRPL